MSDNASSPATISLNNDIYDRWIGRYNEGGAPNYLTMRGPEVRKPDKIAWFTQEDMRGEFPTYERGNQKTPQQLTLWRLALI
jgi:hypothetical protein